MVKTFETKRERAVVNHLGKLLRERHQDVAEQQLPAPLVNLLHLVERRERDSTNKGDHGPKK